MKRVLLLVGVLGCATQAFAAPSGDALLAGQVAESLVVTPVGEPTVSAAGEVWVAASPGGALVYADRQTYDDAAGVSYPESAFGDVLRVGDDLQPALVPYSPGLLAEPAPYSVCGLANQVVQISESVAWATSNVAGWPEYVFDATDQCPIFRFTCDAQYCEIHRVRNGVTERIYKGKCSPISLGCMCISPDLG